MSPSLRRALASTVVLLLAATAACSSTGSPDVPASSPSGSSSATATAHGKVRPAVAGTVATGLQAPWGVAFLPDGSALVTQRDRADVVRVGTDGSVTSVGNVPGVRPSGEGGLLGIALDPSFATDPWVYVYFTGEIDNRVVRIKYEDDELGALQVVLSGLRKGSIHDGGRIAFGPDGYLYVGVGDTGDPSLAQDLGSSNGKILRITTDGNPAPGNPFNDSPVYSYGHRNVQGLAWDTPARLWASEFGQNTWDELNQIQSGKNYGWPVVEGSSSDRKYVNPQAEWPTDQASPSGIAIVGDHVFMAALRGERLWVVPLKDGRAGTPKDYFVGQFGRLRTVVAAPDGSLWLVTNNTDGRGNPKPGDDRILRVTL